MLIFTARRAWSRVVGATLLLVASVIASTRPSYAQTSPRVRVDHQLFDTLLRQHVVDGFVDYDAFARAPEFRRYLASPDSVRPLLLDEDERLAYWINVYNAFTIQLKNILHYPMRSRVCRTQIQRCGRFLYTSFW